MRRRLIATALALTAAPIGALHSQATPGQQQPTWGTTPGQQTGDTAVTQQSQADVRTDAEFIREITADNMLEIRLGRTAASKAENPAVKQFGQRMVTDHTRMRDQWVALASRHGVTFQPDFGLREQEDQVKEFEKLSGSEFDRAYMNHMIKSHQQELDKFQNEGRSARSVEVRQLVAASMPTLDQQLSLARQVGSQVGVGAEVADATPWKNPRTEAQRDSARNAQMRRDEGQTAQARRGNVEKDSKFIREIGADNLLHLRLGELAKSKAEDRAVKQYAERLVRDHEKLQEQWTSMASKNGMSSWKPGMGPRHKEKVTRLERLAGREFDRAYMTTVIQHQQDMLDYFQKEGRAANSAPVRDLVNDGTPVLQQHVRLGKQVGAEVGADTVTTTDRRNARASKKN
jgi:putative membrane protein